MNNFNDQRSNILFSCSLSDDDKQIVPQEFWGRDRHGFAYFRMNAPIFIDMEPAAANKHGFESLGMSRGYSLVQVQGPVVFTASGDSFWGGKQATDYRSGVVNNPNYRALVRAAHQSQLCTRDFHHQFIEGCRFDGYEELPDGRRVMVLRMFFGS
jgi:hypothetical protein